MITKKEFYIRYNTNSPKNLNRHKGGFLARRFLRDLAGPIAYMFAKFNLSANFATLLMAILYIGANIVFAFPSIFSILLFIMMNVSGDLMDCVDGQLARYFGTASEYGKTLDAFVHTFTASTFAMFFSVRVYLLNQNELLLFLGSIGAVSFIFDGVWMKESQVITNEVVSVKKADTLKIVKKIFVIFDAIQYLAIITLITGILDERLHHSVTSVFFVTYIVSIFVTKILFRFYLLFQETSKKRGAWNGWKKI